MGFLGSAPYTVTALQAADIAAYIANPAAGTPNPAATLSTAMLELWQRRSCKQPPAHVGDTDEQRICQSILSTITLGGTESDRVHAHRHLRAGGLARPEGVVLP